MDKDSSDAEGIVFHGCVVSRDDKHITLQVSPGFNVDVEKRHCSSIEEATDPVSGRTFIRIKLTADAEVRSTFQVRLARLAAAAEGGVPFASHVSTGESRPWPVSFDPSSGFIASGSGTPHPFARSYPTIGTSSTYSYNWFWGWLRDDTTYHDWGASSSTETPL